MAVSQKARSPGVQELNAAQGQRVLHALLVRRAASEMLPVQDQHEFVQLRTLLQSAQAVGREKRLVQMQSPQAFHAR